MTSASPEPVRVVVCDLDGVIRHFDEAPQSEMEVDLGLASGSVLRVAFERSLLRRAVTGAISDEQWRAATVTELAREVGQGRAERAVQGWSRSSGRIDPQVLALVRQVRARVPVALLTNATTRLRVDLAALDVLAEFNAIVSSAETGFPKPDPGAFAAAEAAASSALGESVVGSSILFIDDTAAYVQAAMDRGWRATQFVDEPALAATLRAAQLVP
jgi:putative hydrolase of the HAD superfamily